MASRLLALAIALVSLTTAGVSSATVIERVVAVVGERAILLSDLRERATPLLVRIHEEVPPGAQRAAAISQTYKTVLERMVDEELQQRAANQSRIVVSAREVDDAIGRIAAQNRMTVDKLIAEAMRAGLTEAQYRNEIRRQVLEAKLLNLRLQGRVRITDEDLRSAYRRLVVEERSKQPFRAAMIRIDLPTETDKAAVAERRQLAERVAREAASGVDFAELARQHSDDEATRSAGGLMARMRPGSLPRAVDLAILGLDVGEVSAPIRAGRSYYVMKLVEREESELPTFEASRAELGERLYLEKMSKARRHWLDGLRRRTHVEIRL